MQNDYEYSSRGIVAANIKRLMREKGVISSDVCRDLKIPNATFSDWINAKTYPRIHQLENLAAYFGVRKADIVEIYIDRDDPIYMLAKKKTEESGNVQGHTFEAPPENVDEDRVLLNSIYDQLPPVERKRIIAQLKGLMQLYKEQGTGQESD